MGAMIGAVGGIFTFGLSILFAPPLYRLGANADPLVGAAAGGAVVALLTVLAVRAACGQLRPWWATLFWFLATGAITGWMGMWLVEHTVWKRWPWGLVALPFGILQGAACNPVREAQSVNDQDRTPRYFSVAFGSLWITSLSSQMGALGAGTVFMGVLGGAFGGIGPGVFGAIAQESWPIDMLGPPYAIVLGCVAVGGIGGGVGAWRMWQVYVAVRAELSSDDEARQGPGEIDADGS